MHVLHLKIFGQVYNILIYFNSATQEATVSGDPELLKMVINHRDAQIVRHQAVLLEKLLQKLREAPDFYIEIKWEFTSWCELIGFFNFFN